MKYKNLIIVGTSHIAVESIRKVRAAVDSFSPEIIAIELDRRRLVGLLEKRKSHLKPQDIFQLGVKAYAFAVVASYVQKKLGRLVGVAPGSEMLEAVNLAKKTKAQLALIDQDIAITLHNFSNAFTWREKWHFLIDVLKSILFKKREMQRLGLTDFDLTKVPSRSVVTKLIRQVKDRYPSIYKVLIKDRNYVMARNLTALVQKSPEKHILAVVGAGHEDELLKLVRKIDEGKVEFVSSIVSK